jgi:hypothetical protein
MFDDQRNRLLNSLDHAHDAYHKAELFSGPSLYFHLRSLDAAREKDIGHFTEYVYATLASWGMHRMGPGGSKMREFKEFRSSLSDVWQAAMLLQQRTPGSLTECDWKMLKTVFCGIRCMASKTILVGHSKVMAHLLPNLVPPLDRAYTLTFLFKHGRIKNGGELEWKTLVEILDGFFYPVVRSPIFQQKAQKWLAQSNRSNWDTSELKIVDNLLIGLLKIQRAEQGDPANHGRGTSLGNSKASEEPAVGEMNR